MKGGRRPSSAPTMRAFAGSSRCWAAERPSETALGATLSRRTPTAMDPHQVRHDVVTARGLRRRPVDADDPPRTAGIAAEDYPSTIWSTSLQLKRPRLGFAGDPGQAVDDRAGSILDTAFEVCWRRRGEVHIRLGARPGDPRRRRALSVMSGARPGGSRRAEWKESTTADASRAARTAAERQPRLVSREGAAGAGPSLDRPGRRTAEKAP